MNGVHVYNIYPLYLHTCISSCIHDFYSHESPTYFSTLPHFYRQKSSTSCHLGNSDIFNITPWKLSHFLKFITSDILPPSISSSHKFPTYSPHQSQLISSESSHFPSVITFRHSHFPAHYLSLLFLTFPTFHEILYINYSLREISAYSKL